MIQESPICFRCACTAISPLVEAAITNEINYPPRWGSHEIPFEDFQDLLSPETRVRWFEKLAEYRTPVARRVYCRRQKQSTPASANERCNSFLGMTRKGRCVSCEDCSSDTCLECGAPAIRGWHECKPTDDEKSDFDEAVQGLQWQRCPNVTCGVIVELRDGCNAMDCSFCHTGFCFVCGEKADHDSKHWTQSTGSQCPRWNQPNAPNATYDAEPIIDHNDPPEIVPDNVPDNAPDVALEETAEDEPGYGSQDAELAINLTRRLLNELLLGYGNMTNTPRAMVVFLRLLYFLAHNLHTAPQHSAHPDGVGVEAWNQFQQYHPRLENEFLEAYTIALSLTWPGSALHIWGEGKYLLLEILDRYLAVHAERVFAAKTAFEETQVAG